MEHLEGAQQTNVQAGTKDRDRDYLSNQGRRPTVSTGGRSSQRIHPNLLVVFFFFSFCCFLRVVCGASVSRGVCFEWGAIMVSWLSLYYKVFFSF